MENNFSIFDLERRKWELSQERDDSPRSPNEGASRSVREGASSAVLDVEKLYAEMLSAAEGAVESVRGNTTPDPRPAVAVLRKIIDGNLVERLY